MTRTIGTGTFRTVTILVAVLSLVLAACTSDGDTAPPPVVDTGGEATPSETLAPSDEAANVIVQAVDIRDFEALKDAELPPGAPTQSVDPEWDTEFSKAFNISLFATFDSSGDAAWDPAEHPLVYVASEGPGYSGLLSTTVTDPGFLMMDANTRETVASVHYDLQADEVFEPHGLGVSPGGEWIYIPTGTAAAWGSPLGGGRLLIVNAETFKIDKILSTQGNPHHIKSFVTPEGRELTLVENFSDSTFYVLDPHDDNRVVGGINSEGLGGRGYLSFVDPSSRYLFVSLRTPFRDEDGGVAVVDLESWRTVTSINTHDPSPVYVAFTADGTIAYVSGGHSSTVAKIDMSNENPRAWSVDAITSAGTIGPYGVTLNWDETQLWAIGKGEGGHNRGNTMGLVNPTEMVAASERAGSKGSFYTDCVRGDHALVNPVSAMNEMWISCNASFETVIWDFETMTIKESLVTPNGGSTHNGAFVAYDPDFTGQVLSDQNGLHGSALEEKAEIAAAAGS
jgi:DNA-binding beta-propeller fold protein YncE